MKDAIKSAEQSARKVFGADISISVARCPAWGFDDVCLIIRGANHALAAAGFAGTNKGATVETQQAVGFRGTPGYTYSVVTIPAAKAAA